MGKKNLTRKSDRQKSKDRLEVRKVAAVADVVIPGIRLFRSWRLVSLAMPVLGGVLAMDSAVRIR